MEDGEGSVVATQERQSHSTTTSKVETWQDVMKLPVTGEDSKLIQDRVKEFDRICNEAKYTKYIPASKLVGFEGFLVVPYEQPGLWKVPYGSEAKTFSKSGHLEDQVRWQEFVTQLEEYGSTEDGAYLSTGGWHILNEVLKQNVQITDGNFDVKGLRAFSRALEKQYSQKVVSSDGQTKWQTVPSEERLDGQHICALFKRAIDHQLRKAAPRTDSDEVGRLRAELAIARGQGDKKLAWETQTKIRQQLDAEMQIKGDLFSWFLEEKNPETHQVRKSVTTLSTLGREYYRTWVEENVDRTDDEKVRVDEETFFEDLKKAKKIWHERNTGQRITPSNTDELMGILAEIRQELPEGLGRGEKAWDPKNLKDIIVSFRTDLDQVPPEKRTSLEKVEAIIVRNLEHQLRTVNEMGSRQALKVSNSPWNAIVEKLAAEPIYANRSYEFVAEMSYKIGMRFYKDAAAMSSQNIPSHILFSEAVNQLANLLPENGLPAYNSEFGHIYSQALSRARLELEAASPIVIEEEKKNLERLPRSETEHNVINENYQRMLSVRNNVDQLLPTVNNYEELSEALMTLWKDRGEIELDSLRNLIEEPWLSVDLKSKYETRIEQLRWQKGYKETGLVEKAAILVSNVKRRLKNTEAITSENLITGEPSSRLEGWLRERVLRFADETKQVRRQRFIFNMLQGIRLALPHVANLEQEMQHQQTLQTYAHNQERLLINALQVVSELSMPEQASHPTIEEAFPDGIALNLPPDTEKVEPVNIFFAEEEAFRVELAGYSAPAEQLLAIEQVDELVGNGCAVLIEKYNTAGDLVGYELTFATSDEARSDACDQLLKVPDLSNKLGMYKDPTTEAGSRVRTIEINGLGEILTHKQLGGTCYMHAIEAGMSILQLETESDKPVVAVDPFMLATTFNPEFSNEDYERFHEEGKSFRESINQTQTSAVKEMIEKYGYKIETVKIPSFGFKTVPVDKELSGFLFDEVPSRWPEGVKPSFVRELTQREREVYGVGNPNITIAEFSKTEAASVAESLFLQTLEDADQKGVPILSIVVDTKGLKHAVTVVDVEEIDGRQWVRVIEGNMKLGQIDSWDLIAGKVVQDGDTALIPADLASQITYNMEVLRLSNDEMGLPPELDLTSGNLDHLDKAKIGTVVTSLLERAFGQATNISSLSEIETFQITTEILLERGLDIKNDPVKDQIIQLLTDMDKPELVALVEKMAQSAGSQNNSVNVSNVFEGAPGEHLTTSPLREMTQFAQDAGNIMNDFQHNPETDNQNGDGDSKQFIEHLRQQLADKGWGEVLELNAYSQVEKHLQDSFERFGKGREVECVGWMVTLAKLFPGQIFDISGLEGGAADMYETYNKLEDGKPIGGGRVYHPDSLDDFWGGDVFLIKEGSEGHAVAILGRDVDESGDTLLLVSDGNRIKDESGVIHPDGEIRTRWMNVQEFQYQFGNLSTNQALILRPYSSEAYAKTTEGG